MADISNRFSNGLQIMGLELPTQFLKFIIGDCPNAIIVSVGTGNGHFENIMECVIQKKIYCIEPFFNKFNPLSEDLAKKPDYAYIGDFVKDNSSVLDGPIALILNWADPIESSYDYEAILILKPKYIIWIGEINGCAGGSKFHEWFDTCEINKLLPYSIIAKNIKRMTFEEHGRLAYTCMLFERKIKL